MLLQAKELHHQLRFRCQKCGYCCDHTLIELSPFDIRNICTELKITTTDFHQQYSVYNFVEYPKCVLKNRPHCPFKKGVCTIYPSRPIRCRLYPLGRVFQEEEVIYVLPEENCIGFDSGRKQTIAEWLEREGINEHNDLTNEWNRFLIKVKERNLDKVQTVIFKKVFYDFDDHLIMKYRKRMRAENSLEDFMDNLHELFEMLVKMVQVPG